MNPIGYVVYAWNAASSQWMHVLNGGADTQIGPVLSGIVSPAPYGMGTYAWWASLGADGVWSPQPMEAPQSTPVA